MKNYLSIFTRRAAAITPQWAPIQGSVPNSAGGHAFPVDDWTRLDRFLVPAVGQALLERMPLTALVRSLAKLTAVGVLRPLGDLPLVLSALGNADRIAHARMHPLSILLALRTYAQGHGDRGGLQWEPVQAVIDA